MDFLALPAYPIRNIIMKLLLLIGVLFTGFLGIYLGFGAFKYFRNITKEDVKPSFLIINSIVAGVSGFLIFVNIVLIMGFLDENYIWNTPKFLGAMFISLILGIIITVGSFIQGLMVTGFRKVLFDGLKQKGKDQ
jgi:hypothetical protein